jgi:DNA-binding transcriptional MocR family regulator
MRWLSENWRGRRGLLHQRLATELQDAIAKGQISLGSELPTVRALTIAASVSKVTAAQALDQLIESGWAQRRDRAPALARTPGAARQQLAPVNMNDAKRGTRDFQAARVAAPVEEYLEALSRAQERLAPELLGAGRISGGHPELRRMIAKRFTDSGLPTTADEVIVTNGAMGAFASIIDAHPGPVLVEDPTYHVALGILAAKRRRTIGWARTPTWDATNLSTLAQRTKPSVAYLVPDFHNPSGALASSDERIGVGAVLHPLPTLKAVIIDETFFDLDLREPGENQAAPIQHFAALHPNARNIITISGLSKIAWAGLRIGWARVPDPQQRAQVGALADITPPPILDQLIAIELWPELDRIIRDRLVRLRVQRASLLDHFEMHALSATIPAGGLSAWVDLGAPVAVQLRDRLERKGWFISTGATYSSAQPYEQFIRLPFTHESETIAQLFSALGPDLAQLRFAANRR